MGQTLATAWHGMGEEIKHYYGSRIADACEELAAWENDEIIGVDGRCLSNAFLIPYGMPKDYNLQNLRKTCQDLKLDCPIFVFYHCDLGPGNMIVNSDKKGLGIIDWETAGFVPKDLDKN